MFAKVPPKSKKKDASHLDTKSKETDIVINSDIDLSDQEHDGAMASNASNYQLN